MANEARTRGEFRAQAIWIQMRRASSDDVSNESVHSGEALGQDTELASILDAIAEDVARLSAGASNALAAQYASAIRAARQSFPKHLVAGIVRGLRYALKAALMAIKQAAKAELSGRREAAILARRKPLRTALPQPNNPPDRFNPS